MTWQPGIACMVEILRSSLLIDILFYSLTPSTPFDIVNSLSHILCSALCAVELVHLPSLRHRHFAGAGDFMARKSSTV